MIGVGRRIALAFGMLAGLAQPALAEQGAEGWKPPIVLEKQGSFMPGGALKGDLATSSLSCDHGYVEYQIPIDARKVNLFMWHSSSAHVWQNRWDGGEGFQSIFLRRGYPVYLWDGPRVGRANWGCEDQTYKAEVGRDQANFTSWRFGTSYLDWFPGIQFPTEDKRAFDQAIRARYNEFDTVPNVKLQATAAAKALDEIGPSVLLTNSAGGLRAQLAATQTGNVAAIVAYESAGFVFPEGEGPDRADGPFGPITVPKEDFLKLTRVPMQFVWGDHLQEFPVWASTLKQCEQFVALINKYGGHAEILQLSDVGLHGNTHIPFMDMNNEAVADQLSLFLAKNGLDAR